MNHGEGGNPVRAGFGVGTSPAMSMHGEGGSPSRAGYGEGSAPAYNFGWGS
ncbi:hypothetical protein [Paenibacillus hunanensis]|uniref:Uncharacterized protein n=1 Tax=Paenibacillus hunanensis TaxID=539262 RepID=A0ABU1IV43_9BACL|nr:hypothetical protein [Paenibacillus hunanensis]MDR6243120.1 hypothetical protein [Paenibacillus hunanensis]GGJ11688.1 hypothetical protein GCM10008022_21050 [Paenibacillus hunanensis]